MKLYTGLDIHKNSIYGTMMDETGKIIEQRDFPNKLEDLKQFLCGRQTSIGQEAEELCRDYSQQIPIGRAGSARRDYQTWQCLDALGVSAVCPCCRT